MLKILLIISASIFMPHWKNTMMTLSILFMIQMLMAFSPLTCPTSSNPHFFSDNMSSLLTLLSLWTSMLMILASVKIKTTSRKSSFISMILMILLLLMLFFNTSNLMMFYIMFEASLIPTLLLILIWGYQPERLQASMYLMMYTICASLPLLVIMNIMFKNMFSLFMYMNTFTHFSILTMIMASVAFLTKMPMYLAHLWLPKAHVEAPVAGSMILASILLKLGVYGLMRMSFISPSIFEISNSLLAISAAGAIMTSLICLRQQDLKSMIAYSSVSHMALVIMGLSSMSSWGWQGSLTMMIAHGLTSSGLFAMANMNYLSANSRSIIMLKGGLSFHPMMTLMWFIMAMSNMAAPPSLNLVAELFIMTSMIFTSSMTLPAVFLTMLLTTSYSLNMFITIAHGKSNWATNFWKWPNNFNMISSLHLIPTMVTIVATPLLISL